jgi:hypothetical protein
MRLIGELTQMPYECAVIPGRGNSSEQEGFIDTGNELRGWDPHVYVSVGAVKELARFIGLPSEREHERLTKERDELRGQVTHLEAQVQELEEFRDSIDVIASQDYVTRKKPGRPKKESKREVVG